MIIYVVKKSGKKIHAFVNKTLFRIAISIKKKKLDHIDL